MTSPYKLNWQERDRRSLLGGSEAAAVLGLNPYSTDFDVWDRKVNEAPEFEGNSATRWGHLLEPLVVSEMAREDGVDPHDAERVLVVDSAHDSPFIVHPSESWLGVHVDGFVRPSNLWCAVEAKTTRLYDQYGEEGSTDMPDAHYIQCQVESMCTGMPVRYGAFLLGDRRVWRTLIEPDLSVQEQILNKLGEWWRRHIEGGEPPALRGRGAELYLQRRHRSHSDHLVTATPEMRDAIERWRSLDEASKDMKKRLDEAKASVCSLIGDDLGIDSDIGVAKWVTVKGRQSMSMSTLKEHKDILALCKERGIIKTGSPSRSLRFSKARRNR